MTAGCGPPLFALQVPLSSPWGSFSIGTFTAHESLGSQIDKATWDQVVSGMNARLSSGSVCFVASFHLSIKASDPLATSSITA